MVKTELAMIYGFNFVPVNGYRVDKDYLDGDPREVAVVDQTSDGGLPFWPMTIQRGYAMGRAVDPAHVPTRMKWKDRHGHPVPDFDNGFIFNVSERAKQVIEAVESGIHQFLPVAYVDNAGKPLENRWFVIVCNRLDSVDRDQSRMELIKGMMWDRGSFENPRLVLSEKQSAGHHMWRDKHLPDGPYASQELADAINAAGLTGVKMVEMQTA